MAIATSVFPASFNLTDLNGKNGFMINGVKANDGSGGSVASVGDVNGDGLADIIIGAVYSGYRGKAEAGQSYVVFGQTGPWSAALNLTALNGANGFSVTNNFSSNRIIVLDYRGVSVAGAGDVNGDGLADIIIGAPYASPNGKAQAGQSFVVFGRQGSWPAAFNLSSLNGSNGFVLNGINSRDFSGFSVASAGDINGDKIDDIMIGAWAASPNGQSSAGQSYVIFGKRTGWTSPLELSNLNGANGFIINGVNANDGSGFVASVDNINGDGLSNLLISGYGQSYVVFGQISPWPAVLNLTALNRTNSFRMSGSSDATCAGDVNGDGLADIVTGTTNVNPNGQIFAGQTCVVFGRSRSGLWPAILDLNNLNGSDGFLLNGIQANDAANGNVATSAGDINDDGFGDVIIGAPGADPNGKVQAGQSYVVFGQSGLPAAMNLSSLNGNNGFTLNGIATGDLSGISVASAGDINGDGLADVIIGALSSPNGQSAAGQSYIVFGDRSLFLISNQLTVMQGQSVILNNTYLFANSGNFTSPLIQYSVSNVQHGQFELINYPNVAINNFTQAQINAGLVHFVHDGGVNAPNYSVVAQTGIGFAIPPAPQAANVSFSLLTTSTTTSTTTLTTYSMTLSQSSGIGYPKIVSHYPASFNLTDLNGKNGFMINGIKANDESSAVAPVGDINGDGLADIIIGAMGALSNGKGEPGQSYVVFGQVDPWPASLNLTALNGANGFSITNSFSNRLILPIIDYRGVSVAPAGDVNGDGLADIIIGALRASPNGKAQAGQSYVVFGRQGSWPATFNLTNLNGSNGFILNGINADDQSGGSVASAGDVNGDGLADVIIGASRASPNGQTWTGQSYVVFGRSGVWPAVMNLSSLNGSTGFVINGIKTSDASGYSVASAADINGDELADVIIGAPNANHAGQSYVVFGHRGIWDATIELSSLNGVNGFMLNGMMPSDESGSVVAGAGDVNGDGWSDIIIGAYLASPNGQRSAGQSYVVFGRSGLWPAILNLSSLNGSNGFILNDIQAGDGGDDISVASAGDINDDGFDDVIVGVLDASSNGQRYAGQSYVVFGRSSGWPSVMNLSSLTGNNGFVLNGIKAYDQSGISVASAGDINDDGLNDVIIGALHASPNGQNAAGQSYIVFGDRSISLISNRLIVMQGQSIILNDNYLSACPGSFNSSLVQFSVSNVQHGQFELINYPNVAINNFTQAQINAGLVRFVHDGSVNAPNYSVVAQTGIGFAIPPAPQAANVSFSLSLPTSTSTQTSVFISSSTTSSAPASSSSLNIFSSTISLTSSHNPTTDTPTISVSTVEGTSSSLASSSSSSGISISSSTVSLTSSSNNPTTDTPTMSVSTEGSISSSLAPSSSSSSISISSSTISLTNSNNNPPTDTPTISISSESDTSSSSAPTSISPPSSSSSGSSSSSISSTSATLSALSSSSATISSSLASSSTQSNPTSSVTSSQSLFVTPTSPLFTTSTSSALIESSQGSNGVSTTIIAAAAAGGGALALAAGTLFFLHRRRRQRVALAQETKVTTNVIENPLYQSDVGFAGDSMFLETRIDTIQPQYEAVESNNIYYTLSVEEKSWSSEHYAVGNLQNDDSTQSWKANEYTI